MTRTDDLPVLSDFLFFFFLTGNRFMTMIVRYRSARKVRLIYFRSKPCRSCLSRVTWNGTKSWVLISVHHAHNPSINNIEQKQVALNRLVHCALTKVRRGKKHQCVRALFWKLGRARAASPPRSPATLSSRPCRRLRWTFSFYQM